MSRGRKRTPTAILRLTGSEKANYRDAEPEFGAADFDCPADLAQDGRRFWDYYYPLLCTAGVLSQGDYESFVGLCEAFDCYKRTHREAQKARFVLVSEKGNEFQNPLQIARRQAYEQWSKSMIEFGLTPASRSKVTAEPKQADALEDFLKIG